jgi:phosphoglycerol transferase MdoB-like AlkP superfamily enzyme
VFLPVFAVFCRFGGAFNSDNGVPWEDAARTRSHLLNEAILDDGQALYRALKTHERAYRTAQQTISVAELKAAITTLGGNPAAPTVDEAFRRTAPGSPLAQTPQQVVFIVGENYALWPLLPQYRELGLAPTGERLARDGAYTYQFLSAGNGTMTSLNGLFTGLPDVGLSPNYIQTPGGPFGMGIGMVMKSMGYKTVFWYGGLSSWQEIKAFTLREGFDEFHCADEMPQQDEGSWGVPDGTLFDAIRDYMAKDTGKTFHMIMTTTNHPPFAYDVDKYGFPRQAVKEKLPKSIPTDKATIDQLGHIWYADMVMGKFIDEIQKQDPSALFVVTGDHAERFNFATDVSLPELSGIPCFFYGDGVTKAMLPQTVAGSHLQIMPALAALILPAGASYEALLPPLQESNRAFNYRLVIEDGRMMTEKEGTDPSYEELIKAARLVALYRIQHGNTM